MTSCQLQLIEEGIAKGLEDIKRGRVYGPFYSVQEMINSLHRIYLYLDTTERDSFIVALIVGRKVAKKKTVKSARGHSELLLKTISRMLSMCKKSIRDIVGIAVVKGPGSFTSLRIGVAAANALAYGLGVPVIGVGKDAPLSKIGDLFNRNRRGRKVNIVVPEYGREPNITIKKSSF